MTDPRRTKAALAALVEDSDQSPPHEGGRVGPATDATVEECRETIDRATEAVDDVDAAATFVRDVGIETLRRAITAADRAGRDALADRGRDALSSFEAVGRAADADHFRHGRSTSLTGADQPSTEQ